MKNKQPVPCANYSPEQVAEAFTTIRTNLDLIEVAYSEAISTPVPTPELEFLVWDASAGGKLPDQLPRLQTPSESNFYPNSSRVPDLDWLRANACPKYADVQPLVINIECYNKKDNPDDPAPVTAEETEYLRSIVATFQEENPGQIVGVYGVVPERYGGCATCSAAEYQERWDNWTERNGIMQPLADQVARLYPSLYALYSQHDKLVKLLNQNLEQAAMSAKGKPVIGYLWPEWHKNSGLTGFIDGQTWRLLLDTCLASEHCDGIAIWEGSWFTFDENAPWWQATVDFMETNKLNGY